MFTMDDIFHIATHVLEHSVSDTLYLIPFLFVTYLVMEWLEHKTGSRTRDAIRRAGSAGPVAGALLGVVPQCGFSAAASTLWAGRVITLGTVFAVFLSTSDEMIPIFIAEQVDVATIAKILGAKIAIGMVMGFAVDAVLRLARRFGSESEAHRLSSGEKKAQGAAKEDVSHAAEAAREHSELRIHELCERDRCHCGQDCETCTEDPASAYDHHDDCVQGCTHEHHLHDHGHDHGVKSLFKSALVHTVQVSVYIFIVTVALNVVLETVGEEALAVFLAQNPVLSVFASALVGLIPNCAASVVVAQLYVEGALGAGALLAGLLTAAGVGLLVLVRANRHWKQNLAIIVALYFIGVLWGLLAHACGMVF